MTDPQREIDQVERRTQRYWFDDGLVEIATGASFFAAALALLFAQAFQDRLGRWVNLAFPMVVLIVAFAGKWIVQLAKDRYVHPRTGYVSFARPANRWANAAAGLVAAAILAFAVTRTRVLDNWIPAVTGMMLAIGLLTLGRTAGRLRFPLAGISCVVVGVLLSLLQLNENVAVGLLFAWIGVVLMLGGTAAFVAYSRLAPPSNDGRGTGANA